MGCCESCYSRSETEGEVSVRPGYVRIPDNSHSIAHVQPVLLPSSVPRSGGNNLPGVITSQTQVPQRPARSKSTVPGHSRSIERARPTVSSVTPQLQTRNIQNRDNLHGIIESQGPEPQSKPVLRGYNQDRINNVAPKLENLTINVVKPTKRVQPAELSTINNHLFNIHNPASVISYIPLSEYDSDYFTVNRMITNKRRFKVDSIEKIENHYLQTAYELKKAQKKMQYGNVEERLLFHGTKKANLDDICKMNFNWRLYKTHKYGKGISFSPNCNYSSNYSDEFAYNKVMIVAKVLIAKSCFGNQFMDLPNEGCDTSQKGDDGIVIVKYEDNEFCPVYKINYHLENVNGGNQQRNVRRNNVYNYY